MPRFRTNLIYKRTRALPFEINQRRKLNYFGNEKNIKIVQSE